MLNAKSRRSIGLLCRFECLRGIEPARFGGGKRCRERGLLAEQRRNIDALPRIGCGIGELPIERRLLCAEGADLALGSLQLSAQRGELAATFCRIPPRLAPRACSAAAIGSGCRRRRED